MAKLRDLAFIDCETSGLDPEKHEILELAIVRVDPKTIEQKDVYHKYFVPVRDVSPKIRAINGYDEERWRECNAEGIQPKHLDRIRTILTGATPAGQNPSFDLGFLKQAFNIYSSCTQWPEMDYHVLDIASLAWPLFVSGLTEGVGLRHTRKYFGLTGEQHRALSDVLDTIEVYKRLGEIYVNTLTRTGKYIYDAIGSIFEPELEREATERLSCSEDVASLMSLLRMGEEDKVRGVLEQDEHRRRIYVGLGGDEMDKRTPDTEEILRLLRQHTREGA